MSEIYSELPSPEPTVDLLSSSISNRLLDYEDNLGGLGMRTNLHKYQRRSVAAMIQREMHLSNIPDPLFVRLTGMKGQELFYQPDALEYLLRPSMVYPCRGGILCEELGIFDIICIFYVVAQSP